MEKIIYKRATWKFVLLLIGTLLFMALGVGFLIYRFHIILGVFSYQQVQV